MGAADTARLIASLELQDKFSKTADNAIKKTGQLEGKFNGLGSKASAGFGRSFAKVFAGVSIAAGIHTAISEASDLSETVSKVGVVFDKSADQVLSWGKDAATTLGQSKNQALGAAATFGNLFVSLGTGSKEAATMSTKLVDLASDLASFNNVDPEEALLALRSGLVGETEPLRKFGVNLNDAQLREKALALGLVKTTKEVLPPAIKAQAAYALIFEQSKTAQGDFGRTSAGLANQQRILKAQFKDTAAVLGTAVLPSVAKVVGKLNSFVSQNQPAIAEFAAKLPALFDSAVAFAEKIPWDSIGSGLSIAAGAAGTLFDVFAHMPPEAQAVLIGLAGLNKLSGGAVGGIVSELGKGLIKGVLGLNAGVVNINAAKVTGGGGLPPTGPAGVPSGPGLLATLGFVGAGVTFGVKLTEDTNNIFQQLISKVGEDVPEALRASGNLFQDIPKLIEALKPTTPLVPGLARTSTEQGFGNTVFGRLSSEVTGAVDNVAPPIEDKLDQARLATRLAAAQQNVNETILRAYTLQGFANVTGAINNLASRPVNVTVQTSVTPTFTARSAEDARWQYDRFSATNTSVRAL